MIGYTSWTITNWLNSTLIPYWTGNFWWTENYLTYFYQMPWKFYDWINLVFGIKEWWISILMTILLVSIILFWLYNFTTTNHN